MLLEEGNVTDFQKKILKTKRRGFLRSLYATFRKQNKTLKAMAFTLTQTLFLH